MGNPMLEAAICPLCGMGWCGRPCLRDPRKSNALLFKKDGTVKTLKERSLGWDDPPPKMLVVPMRKLKLLPAPKAVTEGTKTSGTKTSGTKTSGTKTKNAGGRPKSGKAMTAAERKCRWLERRKGKPQDFKG